MTTTRKAMTNLSDDAPIPYVLVTAELLSNDTNGTLTDTGKTSAPTARIAGTRKALTPEQIDKREALRKAETNAWRAYRRAGDKLARAYAGGNEIALNAAMDALPLACDRYSEAYAAYEAGEAELGAFGY